jgi:hypothetical protein
MPLRLRVMIFAKQHAARRASSSVRCASYSPAFRERFRFPRVADVEHLILRLADLRASQIVADRCAQLPAERVRRQRGAERAACLLEPPHLAEPLCTCVGIERPQGWDGHSAIIAASVLDAALTLLSPALSADYFAKAGW